MDYTKKIEACNTLDELFCLWREAQGKEPEDSCCGVDGQGGTFPRRKDGTLPNYKPFKDSFCPDGVTSRVGNESSKNRCQVLFILKESNVTATDGNYDYDYFWFNEKVEESDRETYAERFELAIQRLIETQGLNQEDSKLYGYMNLNKRGGYGGNYNKALEAYVQEYQSFIRKQISLLSPKYIIGCSELVYNLLKKYNLVEDPSAKVYYIYHPSYLSDTGFNCSLDNIGRLQ